MPLLVKSISRENVTLVVVRIRCSLNLVFKQNNFLKFVNVLFFNHLTTRKTQRSQCSHGAAVT